MAPAVLAVALAAPLPARADDPPVKVELKLSDCRGKARTRFWYGEPIRFGVAVTADPPVRVSLRGSTNPLFPVGDGLQFERSDKARFRVALIPAGKYEVWCRRKAAAGPPEKASDVEPRSEPVELEVRE